MTDHRITKAVEEAVAIVTVGGTPDHPAVKTVAEAAIQAYEAVAAQITTDEPCRFSVSGSSVFPIDMLRHDHCWPVGGDFNRIGFKRLGDDPATIELCAQSARCVTPLRWASFGWIVTEVNGVTVVWENGRPIY